MAVKIPIYEDRLTPSGGFMPSSGLQARGVEVSDAIGRGVQNLGMAGVGFSAQQMEVAKREEEKRQQEAKIAAEKQKAIDDANAVSAVGRPMSEGTVYWSDWLDKQSKSTVDGGYITDAEGKKIELRAAAEKEFDAWAKKFVEPITNEKARIWAESHINQLRTHTLTTALTIQAKASVANRAANLDVAVNDLATVAAKDATRADDMVTDALSLIANSGLDEITRNKVGLAAKKQIMEAANTGMMERQPTVFRDAIMERYGVAPTSEAQAVTDVAKRLGISAEDLATIISYETGGTMSPSKRGGKNNKHIGLIQFGEAEQKTYGASEGQSFGEQMQAVEKYLKDRGVRQGDDLTTLYRIINGGSRNVPLTASDGNGTIAEHVQRMQAQHAPKAMAYLQNGGSSGRAVPTQISSLVGQLDTERLPAYLSQATTLVNKEQAAYRSQVETVALDHTSAFMNGDMVQKPLTEGEFVRAYGMVDGPQRYSSYVRNQQLGSDLSSMRTMPTDQISGMLEANKPDASKPGYDAANKRYAVLTQAAERTVRARAEDPMLYAMRENIGGVKPIDWNDQAAASAELTKRAGVASTMMQSYNAPGFAMLTKDEASKLAAGFNNMGARQKLGYLATMFKAVPQPEAQRAIIQQIAPDSPLTAVAGSLMMIDQVSKVGGGFFTSAREYTPTSVATMILRGEAILNPTKGMKGEDGKPTNMIMPKEIDMRPVFNSQVGKAFANQERDAQVAYQAVKAYYAAKSEEAGDYSGEINSGRLNTAIEAVIGGISDVNGKGEVRRPWGMPEPLFRDRLKTAFDAEAKQLNLKGVDAVFGVYGLENFRDGYLLRSGTGPLLDKNGLPMVLKLDTSPAPNMVASAAPNSAASGVIRRPAPVIDRPNTQRLPQK